MTGEPRGDVDVATGELWLPIPGHDTYEASDAGRIRRVRLIAPARQSKGYLKVSLGRANQLYVHQAVMLAHAGPPPTGHNIDHYDFDRANNTLTNLRYLPKHLNDWRWQVHEEDVDPAEVARVNALYQESVATGRVPDQVWSQSRPA